MKIAVICGRFPEHGFKGDQLRTRQLIDLLAGRHQLHVITGGRPSSPSALAELREVAGITLVSSNRLSRTLSALELAVRGRPLQVGWMSTRPFRRAARSAAAASDVAIVSTVRCLAEPLPTAVVLDHIDALSTNIRARADLEPRGLIKLGARLEARLLSLHEQRAASWAAAQIVVSGVDAADLPPSPQPVVVPHVQPTPSLRSSAARDIDVIFTGSMRYPPNRDAALWLDTEIVPALRRRSSKPVRVVVAGRHASSLPLAGVEVESDVPDLGVLLSRARVAAIPLRSGTGVANKLLEAAANGAAIVATPRAARAAEIDVDVADDPDSFAEAIARLLADDVLRDARAKSALAGLAQRDPVSVRATIEAILQDVKER